MKKTKVGIIGTGFMGRVHIESLRRLGNVEVVGLAASSKEKAIAFAEEVGVDFATGDYRDLLTNPEIEVIHVCSPNSMHFDQTMASFNAGKHVVCEKPLADNVEAAQKMIALANEKNLLHCTLYNVRGYPQVQNMRRMCEEGFFGDIMIVQGTFSQDWLMYDTDWNWRVIENKSRTFADIGTHWCDLVEHITGKRITSLVADVNTFLKTRKKPKGSVETFKGKDTNVSEYTEVPITTEDFAGMIFKMGETRGSMTASQVSAGRKCRIFVEIFGTKASAVWDAERAEELWVGHRNEPSQLQVKDATLFPAAARSYSDLPGGHSEGYDATFKQTFKRFYNKVQNPSIAIEYPTFADGLRQMQIIDAVFESSKKQAWVSL